MMKKFILSGIVIISGFAWAALSPASAQMDRMMCIEPNDTHGATEQAGHDESVEEILDEILTDQGISSVQELGCDQLSDEELEQLGDAVMERQHPGEAHEVMDRMMGGEGSESLRQMHINMGSAFLGCNTGYGPGMMNGMMGMGYDQDNTIYPGQGGGPMGMMNFGSMMGMGYGNASTFGLLGGLTWLALIAFLLSGSYFFIKHARKD